MKAAVVAAAGELPAYGDFKEPVAASGECRIAVTAAALSPVVKSRASGAHYSAQGSFPLVAGIDGVGRLDDGRRVYFVLPKAPFGSMAERVVVPSAQCISVPEELDDITAAALPNPGMSSWAAFRERAKLVAGETVLVNGATGTAGRLAVRIAKYLGARKVIATGRNAAALQSVKAIGADVAIPFGDNDAALENALAEQFAGGVNVVIDYLWGRSASNFCASAPKQQNPTCRSVLSKSAPPLAPISSVRRGAAFGSNRNHGERHRQRPAPRPDRSRRRIVASSDSGRLCDRDQTVRLSHVEQAWPGDGCAPRVVFAVA